MAEPLTPLTWLAQLDTTPWHNLAEAARSGLPVPDGFVVFPRTPEQDIRNAYDELKFRQKTHFIAIRGPSHAILNIFTPDALIYNLRRLWTESPGAALLVQQMAHSMWCGIAQWRRKNLRIKANEGIMVLDPDTYLFSAVAGKCIRKTLEPKQRKMIRHVDGTMRMVERQGKPTPLNADQLERIAELARQTGADITWAIDDRDLVWLISIRCEEK